MKVRLVCREEMREELERMLRAGGFEISEPADLTLTEENFSPTRILIKDVSGEAAWVEFDELEMVESFNHELTFHVGKKKYVVRERLYAIEEELPKDKFVRVNQSCIVNRTHIARIMPTFGSRYDLTMKCGIKTSVTRSYYTDFKRRFGL